MDVWNLFSDGRRMPRFRRRRKRKSDSPIVHAILALGALPAWPRPSRLSGEGRFLSTVSLKSRLSDGSEKTSAFRQT